MNDRIDELVQLSREIGREDRHLAILGEGNTSTRLDEGGFAVKGSGCSLGTLTAADVVACDTAKILRLLEARTMTDAALEVALNEARLDPEGRKPSTEAVFHAWLLGLPGIEFVGHCHPVSANQVLCSPRARDFAERRLFPDEIVCCGPVSVFVPYADPGLPLAREIRERVGTHMQHWKTPPRLILLQNHGLIALGGTPQSVLACLLMASKAAAIFMGAAALGGPVFLPQPQVERIATRPDEAHRQRQLGIA